MGIFAGGSPRRHFTVTDATTYGAIRHEFARPRDHFAMLPDRWLRDTRLSLGAIGLLSHLHSHTPGFDLDMESLAARFKTGIRALRTYRRELEAAGYLRFEGERDERGVIRDWTWTLTDPSQSDGSARLGAENQTCGSARMENSTNGEPRDHKQTNHKQTNDKNTRALNAAGAASDDGPVDNSTRRWVTGDPIPDGTRGRLNDALLVACAGTHLAAEVERLRALPDWSAVAQRVGRWCGVQAAVEGGAAPGPLVSALLGHEYDDDEHAWAAFLASSATTEPRACITLDSGYCDLHGRKDCDARV